jgi:hypothetical protein
MVIDGSGSIGSSEWNTIKQAVAQAINDTVPRDETVELTIVQFGYSTGNGYAKTEVPPTIIDSSNYVTVSNTVLAMSKGGGSTPMAHGLYLGWKEVKNSPNFLSAQKQIINLATDGEPNIRNQNATSDLDGSGSTNYDDDVIAVANNAVADGLDELDAEGIGITNSNRDWLKSWVVQPQPGNLAPPFVPGWIRVVQNFTEFADTIGEKFEALVVDITPPVISNVHQQPETDNVYPEDRVEISANVTDDLSGVKQVILNYTVDNAAYHLIAMTNLQGNLYNATIPQYPYNTNISYVLMATDFANNSITTEEMGFTYQYNVIPEFPGLLMLPLVLVTAWLIVTALKRRKLRPLKTTVARASTS